MTEALAGEFRRRVAGRGCWCLVYCDDFLLGGDSEELCAEACAVFEQLMRDFGVQTAPLYLYDGPEINGIGQMAVWLPRVLWRGLVDRDGVFGARADGARAAAAGACQNSTPRGALSPTASGNRPRCSRRSRRA